ncbi:hypothetical protein WJ68_16320 [Burkholderia ubonensis]|uniref:Single-stranded DNA-binding protein n=2 Tax=Burkholderia ubonensis TaxID=101571 RepID=A0ABD4E1G7_9BURK|nr:hypothetical protein WJ68_16320 [Burkholderia ubonensis]
MNLIPLPGGHMGEFFGALAAAQGTFLPIEKNKDVTIRPRDKAAYSFKYADLAEILDKTKAGRAENKLALTQLVTNKPPHVGGVMIRTILGHISGARIEAVLDVPRGREGEVKDFGGYITYLRRYIVGPMLGVAADDDLDENGDGHGVPDEAEGDLKGGYSPTSSRNLAPTNPAESPVLRDAKSVRDLTTKFNQFSAENKQRFREHYERRLEELDPSTGKPAAAAATDAQKDDL